MSVTSPIAKLDRRPLILLLGLLLLVGAGLVGAMAGAVRTPFADVWAALTGTRSGRAALIWNLRIPRVLLAATVGANLALAGALLQSLTRNALAEPHLLGISAGGGLAAVLALKLNPATPFSQLPPVSFAGALLAAFLVYGLAWKQGVAPLRLVLAGVATGALLTALTTGILLTSQITLQTTMLWLSGGLSARTWSHLQALLPFTIGGLLVTVLLARALDVLALGDEPAAALGLPVQLVRGVVLAVVALLTGSSVAVAGLIGFVGLIVPHIARLLVGPRHAYLLPVSAILGGVLLVCADAIARTVAAPRELPIGIVTAVMGAPFFLWMLRRAA